MVKLYTEVVPPEDKGLISLSDKIMVLGSCFADRVGERMKNSGFDVCVNPFGTLYNPASILSALRRLESGIPFTEEECVEMGAGAGLVCSFSHHTSFARADRKSFLEVANGSLQQASSAWKQAGILIITLGTAYVWIHEGKVVSNCLKRPSNEFAHRMLSMEECVSLLSEIKELAGGRKLIFTVSPIRHLSQGAHCNNLSKARLLLSIDELQSRGAALYFPSYEILLDELRDYRFYDDDLVHPASKAVDIIWERFLDSYVTDKERETIRLNEKAARRNAHRSILDK